MARFVVVQESDTPVPISDVVGYKERGGAAKKRPKRGHPDDLKGSRSLWQEDAGAVLEELVETTIAYLGLTPVSCQQIPGGLWSSGEVTEKRVTAIMDVHMLPVRLNEVPIALAALHVRSRCVANVLLSGGGATWFPNSPSIRQRRPLPIGC